MSTDLETAELAKVFAANLRARRRERQLTQTALAEASGVSCAFICQLEKELRVPSFDLLAPLATALGTTPDALLTPGIFAPPY